MVVAYDGTAYSGWQLQPHAPTIQAHVERALSTVLREARETLVVGAAGRTDAGVHAAGQVVQFHTNRPEAVDPEKLPLKLNSLLPHDIRVGWMAATAPDFNVTCSASGKVRARARARRPQTGATCGRLAFVGGSPGGGVRAWWAANRLGPCLQACAAAPRMVSTRCHRFPTPSRPLATPAPAPLAPAQIYHYSIDTGRAHNPLTHRHRVHSPRPLDVAAMRAGAALLVGRHDFTQFSNNAPERLRRSPVKDLWRLDVLECEGGLRLEVEGSGFLYKQVRRPRPPAAPRVLRVCC
jgi:tRNA pseudouridine(38-40) synthase